MSNEGRARFPNLHEEPEETTPEAGEDIPVPGQLGEEGAEALRRAIRTAVERRALEAVTSEYEKKRRRAK